MLINPYTSTVPVAIDALVDALTAGFAAQAEAGGDQVYVRDGPWTAGQSGGTYAQDLAVCWYGFYPGYQFPSRSLSEELGDAVVSAHNDQQGWGPGQEESFTIGCASLVAYGGEADHADFSKLRTLAYRNVSTAAGYIADPQAGGQYLNGAAMKLVIAPDTSLHMVSQRRGILVIVTFGIGCTAQTQQ
jgi:hypothetical protein